jgi:hypothetical protein
LDAKSQRWQRAKLKVENVSNFKFALCFVDQRLDSSQRCSDVPPQAQRCTNACKTLACGRPREFNFLAAGHDKQHYIVSEIMATINRKKKVNE